MGANAVAPHALIDALVEHYNSQDVRKFADCFAVDAWHGTLHGAMPQVGREAIYARYVDVFREYPQNRTEVIHRIMFGKFVIDHERVRRRAADQPFDVAVIYTIENDRIKRAEFVRE
jgi:uncharacterized protein (TIGR02246 family)